METSLNLPALSLLWGRFHSFYGQKSHFQAFQAHRPSKMRCDCVIDSDCVLDEVFEQSSRMGIQMGTKRASWLLFAIYEADFLHRRR